QIQRFGRRGVAVQDKSAAAGLKQVTNGALSVYAGEQGLEELIDREDIDIVISSLVGFAGLKPTLRAIKRGKTIALANKETLVVAGEIITRMIKEHGATLIPVDSEQDRKSVV